MFFPSSFTSGLSSALPSTSSPDGERAAKIESFTLGTGASIYSSKLIPAILSAREEIILVTCFWAQSKTAAAISQSLKELATYRSQQQPELPTLRVRICLSSRSLFQKLFHTSSPDGYIYPPTTWESKLGLPSPELLARGSIDLRVKSLFFLPFSVMHPKFLVVDRQRAFVPSCNVSWEAWLEGCVEISRCPSSPGAAGGDAIDGLLEFYRGTWDRSFDIKARFGSVGLSEAVGDDGPGAPTTAVDAIGSSAEVNVPISLGVTSVIWLPSSHNRNPNFRPFPWQTSPPAPSTPLNMAIQWLFDNSKRDIYIQTPNLTSPPVLKAITDALGRGVNVTIVTSRNMMLLEQLLTAGTTTDWCIRGLVTRYKVLCQRPVDEAAGGDVDLEAQRSDAHTPGTLEISYFRSRAIDSGVTLTQSVKEPVHSHLKLSIFDGEYTVFGSGNMDRASWYTSQELGAVVYNSRFAGLVKGTVDEVLLDGRLDLFFG